MKAWLPLLFLLSTSFAATAAAQPEEHEFWSVQFENDTWSSHDRFYTQGLEVSVATIGPPPRYLQLMANALPFYKTGALGVHGYSVGMKMFTPEDIRQSTLVVDERPYAGFLFSNMGIAHLYEERGNEQRINGLMLTVGIVGPSSLAGELQRASHRLIGSPIPEGWDNQLDDELGINLTYTNKWRAIYPLQRGQESEFSYHGGLTLGNVYTYASAGAMLRWGTRLMDDIGPPSITPGFPGIPAFRPGVEWNWYLYGGVEVRAVARNLFLDGNTFQQSHSVEKENLVMDAQFGLSLRRNNVRFSLSNIVRSREYIGQPEETRFAAINLTVYTR